MRKIIVILSVFIILIFQGCAYYNTFYNARLYFEKGMQEKDRGGSGKGNFDKSAEKCGKLIKFYPRSAWVDDAIFLLGRIFLEEGQYEKAKRKFNEIIIYYPKSSYLDDAYLYLGITYLKSEEFDYALFYLRKSEEIGDKDIKQKADYYILKTYVEKKDLAGALQEGKKIMEVSRDNSPEFIFLLGRIKEMESDHKGALEEFEKLLKLKGQNKYVDEAKQKIAEIFVEEGKYDEALNILKGMDNRDVYLVKSHIFEGKGLFGKAIGTLEGVIDSLPDKKKKAQVYFEIGRIYEEDLNNLEKAKENYDKTGSMGKFGEITESALQKSASISLLEKVQSDSTDTTEDRGKSQFLLAELYFTELHKPKKAITAYKSVYKNYPKSKYAPKAAYAIAYIYDFILHNNEKAKDMYRFIVKTYPGTPYEKRSNKRLKKLNGISEIENRP